jgi:hypothetical protein
MKESQILFCAGEGERTGGLTFLRRDLRRARGLRGQKRRIVEGLEVGVRMRGAVDYSHGKQKFEGCLFAADLISTLRESA